MKSSESPSDRTEGIRLGQLGFSLALSVALDLGLCIVLGVWADRKFGTEPILTLVGVLLGLVTAGVAAWAIMRKINRRPPPAA